MSKAFTKETDAPEQRMRKRGVAVPEPNYVTPSGLEAMRREAATATGDRLRELEDHLLTAVAIDPPTDGTAGVGSTIVLEDEHGTRTTYRIVGAIEASPKDGAISWDSPIAMAIGGNSVGDTVTLPRGDFEIVSIS